MGCTLNATAIRLELGEHKRWATTKNVLSC
jgi:hypothetical protein